MAKFFTELFEPSALSPSSVLSKRETKRFFSKITVSETETPSGDYRSLYIKEDLFENERLKNRLVDELSLVLRYFFDKYEITRGDKVLVAALGNEQVTADRLGCAVCDKLLVTAHVYDTLPNRYGNLAAVKCGVSGTTGIESFSLLKAVVEREKPKLVLAVDALACGKTDRLAKVIQCTDVSIEPGGGVDNAKKILSKTSLSVPLVAIGVPTVMYARKILAEFCRGDYQETDVIKTLTVTAKEIDYQIRDFSSVIAAAINETVHDR